MVGTHTGKLLMQEHVCAYKFHASLHTVFDGCSNKMMHPLKLMSFRDMVEIENPQPIVKSVHVICTACLEQEVGLHAAQ